MTDDLKLIEEMENYFNGGLTNEQKKFIDVRRKSDPTFDQMYQEFSFFLNNLQEHGNIIHLRNIINDISNSTGGSKYSIKASIIELFKTHKKTMAVAASVAIIFSFLSASMVNRLFSPVSKNGTLKPLVEKIRQQDHQFRSLKRQIDQIASTQKPYVESNFRATGFLFDVKNNLILTNAHVIDEAPHQIVIENTNGEQFSVQTIYKDAEKDIAILQITDKDFKTLPPTPFNIRKSKLDLGEQAFTMGFPKPEIVYGEGYVSAQNGYEMDSSFFQLSLSANEGSSGSPVIGNNGELIGMIASKEANAQSVVFATKSKEIIKAIDSVKNIEGFSGFKINSANSGRKSNKSGLIRKICNYIFMVKGN